jgi:hypothetical protein
VNIILSTIPVDILSVCVSAHQETPQLEGWVDAALVPLVYSCPGMGRQGMHTAMRHRW